MTELQNGTTGEQTVDAIVATADAVQIGLREGQDAAADVAQQWVSRLAGLPFTALIGGSVGPVLTGRVWVEGAAETVDALLAVQRRSVERLLDAQFRATRLMAESGMALATAGWRAVGSTTETGPDRTAP